MTVSPVKQKVANVAKVAIPTAAVIGSGVLAYKKGQTNFVGPAEAKTFKQGAVYLKTGYGVLGKAILDGVKKTPKAVKKFATETVPNFAKEKVVPFFQRLGDNIKDVISKAKNRGK